MSRKNFVIAFHCFPGYFFPEYLLKVPLTVVDEFHSHLEPLNQIPLQTFRKQVRFIRCLDNVLQQTLIILRKRKLTHKIVHLTDFLQLCIGKQFVECHQN